jgi:hypothetical protein
MVALGRRRQKMLLSLAGASGLGMLVLWWWGLVSVERTYGVGSVITLFAGTALFVLLLGGMALVGGSLLIGWLIHEGWR